jgi:ribosomal protein S18 acetylase RimI-like enzyme
MSDAIEIRRQFRPTDPDAIVDLHRRIYPREYGVDTTFVGFVQAAVDAAVDQGWPGEREGLWVVERHGQFAGCVAYTDEGQGVAMLRWFVFDPVLRGRGLGRRLVRELLAEVEEKGYSMVRLETFSDLRAAARIYLDNGFEVVSAETGPRWGRDEVTYQRYELALLQSTSTTAPPRRGSPPPSSDPSALELATAWTPPK